MDHSTSLNRSQETWLESFENGLFWRRWCLFLHRISPQFGLWSLLFFLLAPHNESLSIVGKVSSLILGSVLIVSSIALRVWTKGYSKILFVREGAYEYVKNPLQVAAVLGYMGLGLIGLIQFSALAIFLVLTILIMSLFFKVQERELIAQHGNPMLRYGQRQRLWIPSRQPGGGVPKQVFSARRAFREEATDLAWYVLGLSVVVYLRIIFQ